MKARFYLHTAEVRPNAYQQAKAEAPQGITDPADDFVATFSGNTNEQNFWYQFDVVQRSGYIAPDTQFVNLLNSRNDPRLSQYFNSDQSDLAPALVAPNYSQPLVTANEDLLIWSESAYRTGDETTAREELNAERALAGLSGCHPLSRDGRCSPRS